MSQSTRRNTSKSRSHTQFMSISPTRCT
uniref:Uncharacterized protein n=1 Tax=Anopheles minimus TaxID=112268 RepID=A0A182WPY9_9DIPT